MAARIRSLRNFITPIDEASRDDLVVADVVTVQSLDAATTYAWALVFRPEGSTAAFSGSLTAVSPGSFTVDLPGPYLIRLIVDATLPTENEQYVRLRALTSTLGLKLVAAGERRDSTGSIPVDVDPVGWAYNQNFNLLALEAAIGSGGSQDLASVLSFGNTTGGNPIILTSGDIIRGQQAAALGGDVVFRGGTPLSGVADGGNVELRPGAGLGGGTAGYIHLRNPLGTQGVRLTVPSADTLRIDSNAGGGAVLEYDASTGKLTVPGVIDPTALVLSDPAAGTDLYFESSDGQTAGLAPANRGRIRYNNATLQWEQSINGGAYAAIGSGGGSGGILEYHEDFPVAPNSTVQYRGWVPTTAELTAIRVYMQVVNTVGAYVLSVQNEATGNPCVLGTVFDMNTLVATNVTSVPLTAVPADLQFAAQGRWTIALTSNNAGFDGSGIYVELEFAHGTAGLSGQDLSTTLTFGNATGGSDIVLSTGDQFVGEAGLALAGNASIRGGTATGGIADGGDVVLRPGAGVGGGTDGSIRLQNAAGTDNVLISVTAPEEISIGTTLPMIYNGTTGKLTVPGILDPTGLVFEEAATITTGATEGGLFVSDGTGGRTAGRIYYRAPSNGAYTDLVAGGGTDTYTAPNEYYVDPALPMDVATRQYPTIALALAAATISGDDPVVVRLAETNHIWSGTNLSNTGTTTIWSVGDASIQWGTTTTLSTDGTLTLRHITHNSRGTTATGTVTVITAPLAAGDTVVINGTTFTGVAGPRSSGADDFDATLGTVTALAAEIVAALEDINNSGTGTSALSSLGVITVTADVPGSAGNAITLASVTVPPGGITVSGPNLTGGADATITVGVANLVLDENKGDIYFNTADTPSLVLNNWLIQRSEMNVAIVGSGTETLGGMLRVEQSDISNDDTHSVFDHTLGTGTWSMRFELESHLSWVDSTASDVFVNNAGDLLTVTLRSSAFHQSSFNAVTLMTGGTVGINWVDSVVSSPPTEGGGTITFGTTGSQSNLYLGGFQPSSLPTDAPDGTRASSNNFGELFFKAAQFGSYGQWRADGNVAHLTGSFGGGSPTTLTDVFRPFDPLVAFDIATLFSNTTVRVKGTILFTKSGAGANTTIFDVDAVLLLTNTPGGSFVYGGTPTLLYETSVGQFLVALNVVAGVGFEVVCTNTGGFVAADIRADLALVEGYES